MASPPTAAQSARAAVATAVEAAEARVAMAYDIMRVARDIADVKETVADLASMLGEHRTETKELLVAFRNATFALAMVKWIAAAITAVSALWFVVTHFGTGK